MKVRKNLSSAFDRHATASVAETIARFEGKQTNAMPALKLAATDILSSSSQPYSGGTTSLSVWLRVRPPVAKDGESKTNTIEILESKKDNIFTTIRTFPPVDSNAARVNREKVNGIKQYEFQQVFGPATTQHELYSTVAAPLVHGLFGDAGESALLFCYGITNAGKSFTSMGDAHDQSKWGIIPRALQDIFARLQGAHIELNMSYLEIYNENVHDLLPSEEQPSYERRATLKIREQQDGEIFVSGLAKHKVDCIQHGLELAQLAKSKRHTSSNNINADSSRSHCICQLELSSGVKLWIVDLAGSERTKRTAAGATRQKEATLINTSLMTLMRCLSAMQHHQKVVPYRESKLTHLFMSHLTSKSSSRTTMIVNVNPAAADFDETQHVLGYAVAAKSILINKDEYIKKRKDMGLFDINGRKTSKISRLAKKYSPKQFLKKSRNADGENNNKKRKADSDIEVPDAEAPDGKVPRPDSVDCLRKMIKSLEASLSIAQAEVEGLRLERDEQADELAELEERVRTEVSDEMEQHFSSTRDEYDRIIENLQNQVKSNPAGARSEKKVQMDKAEQMIEELVDKVEECEEEMVRMRAEHDEELRRLQAESDTALAEKEAYIRNLREEHASELSELQASKDAMSLIYQKQLRELEDQSEQEDEGDEDHPVFQQKENTSQPRRLPRSRTSKVACEPDSIPEDAPEKKGCSKNGAKNQPFGSICENSYIDSEDLVFPKKQATLDDSNGTYVRPMGRAPRGREWDARRGAWRLSVC